MDDDTVALYRCKKCQVRMFLRDCIRHYQQCVGGKYTPTAFERGPANQQARPGDAVKPLHPPKPKGGRPKKGDRKDPDDEEEALDVD